MERKIYTVYALVVDANGTHNTLSGYPKTFDSRNYNNDVAKAYQRAHGEFFDTIGAMCKRDDRQVQTVILFDQNGNFYDTQTIGTLPEVQAVVSEE